MMMGRAHGWVGHADEYEAIGRPDEVQGCASAWAHAQYASEYGGSMAVDGGRRFAGWRGARGGGGAVRIGSGGEAVMRERGHAMLEMRNHVSLCVVVCVL